MLKITWDPEKGYLTFDFNKNTGMGLVLTDAYKNNEGYRYFEVIMEGVFDFFKMKCDKNTLEKATNALIEIYESNEKIVKEVKVK